MDSNQIKKFNSFDHLLSSGVFRTLTDQQKIQAYWFFENKNSEDKSDPFSYEDLQNEINPLEIQDLNVQGYSPLDFIGYRLTGCFDGNSLVGFSASIDERDHTYLGGIAVKPTHQRRGIMEGLIHCLRQDLPITCKVEKSNDIAIQAFSKYGFIELSKDASYLNMTREPVL